jgi:hypothetical protein
MSLKDTIKSLEYVTPPGKVDLPYFYIYDATGLTDATDKQNVILTVDYDSEFILRRICGLRTVLNTDITGKYQVRDKSGLQFFQSPIRLGVLQNGTTASSTWPVMPEKLYPQSSQISFDLFGVQRKFNPDTPNIYYSFLGFHGIRRFNQGALWVHQTNYDYHSLPYTYQFGLNIDWGHWTDGVNGIATPPRVFYVQVLETDFELCAIGVTRADGTDLTTNDFQLSLYDPSGSIRLSNIPINTPFFNYNGAMTARSYGKPVFPTPSIVWPMKGLIKFEITSLLPFGTSSQVMFHFMGMWRQRNSQ